MSWSFHLYSALTKNSKTSRTWLHPPRSLQGHPWGPSPTPEPSLLSAMAALGSTRQTQLHPSLLPWCLPQGSLPPAGTCWACSVQGVTPPRATNCQWRVEPVGEHGASFLGTDRPSEDFAGASRALNHQFPQRTILITHPSKASFLPHPLPAASPLA